MNRKCLANVINFLFVALLIGVDQLSKYYIRTGFTGGKTVSVIPGVFSIVSHRNTGAVWGIMSDATGLLAAVSVLIFAVVLFFYIKLPYDLKRYRPLKVISLLVMAGAIGNFIDRVALKYVVDFLYFELIDFPVFNIADCYITVSLFVLIFLFIFYYKDEDFAFLSMTSKKAARDEKEEN